jgi:hypothetical protein
MGSSNPMSEKISLTKAAILQPCVICSRNTKRVCGYCTTLTHYCTEECRTTGLSDHMELCENNPSDKCDGCGKRGIKLKRCAACNSVRYCSEECQRAAWKLHRIECKKIKERLEADKELLLTPKEAKKMGDFIESELGKLTTDYMKWVKNASVFAALTRRGSEVDEMVQITFLIPETSDNHPSISIFYKGDPLASNTMFFTLEEYEFYSSRRTFKEVLEYDRTKQIRLFDIYERGAFSEHLGDTFIRAFPFVIKYATGLKISGRTIVSGSFMNATYGYGAAIESVGGINFSIKMRNSYIPVEVQ